MHRVKMGAALAFLATAFWPLAEAQAIDYYVDSAAGSDSNNGTSSGTPWRSLSKVNATTFSAGDRILLRAGGVWSGTLAPKGSGSAGTPIRIDRFGTGNKPIINGAGAAAADGVTAAVFINGFEYWDIQNLDVTNHGAVNQTERVGIRVLNPHSRTLRGIRVANNTVHDVYGYQVGFYGHNAGIAVTARNDANATWSDVTIEGNTVHTVERMGIFVGLDFQRAGTTLAMWDSWPKSTTINIRNNSVRNSGGDCILNFVTSNVTVQNNVCADGGSRAHTDPGGITKSRTGYVNVASAAIWSAASRDTTMQFNEVYNDTNPVDGTAFDIDLGSVNTVVQYNYSHGNRGLALLCEVPERDTPASPVNPAISGARVRYNISQNERDGAVRVCREFPRGVDPVDINNNTVYLGPSDESVAFIKKDYFWEDDIIRNDGYVYNNIFYSLRPAHLVRYSSIPTGTLDYNVFYGHPRPAVGAGGGDQHPLTSDPKLVAPGSGQYGIGTVGGYKLQAGSPAIGSGTNTGSWNLGPRDYWGNTVSSTGVPNRGAYNGGGEGASTLNFALGATVTASSSYEADGWSRHRAVDGSRSTLASESAGYSSEPSPSTSSTCSAWIALNFGTQKTFSKVVLYPRNDSGFVGAGFPTDFKIQLWNGTQWIDRKVVTGAGTPTVAQTYSWGFSDFTDRVRICATRLKPVGATDHRMQFAEIEVNP